MRDSMMRKSFCAIPRCAFACLLPSSALASDDPPSDSPKIATVLKVRRRVVSHLGEFLRSSSRRPREG